MRKEQFICPYTLYENLDELEPRDAELMRLAHDATKSAYAPYSKFHVGAAVRLANGAIVTGNNIENAAYPSGLCHVCSHGAISWRGFRGPRGDGSLSHKIDCRASSSLRCLPSGDGGGGAGVEAAAQGALPRRNGICHGVRWHRVVDAVHFLG